MTMHSEDLRKAVGRALKRVRDDWQLTLDDVEQVSTAQGVRITRSHLSRVENGEADIALPRFLSLMRAVGEPAAAVVERLDALFLPEQDVASLDPAELAERGRRALAAGDPLLAARLLRRAGHETATALETGVLVAWSRAEAALGRWQAARHALQAALGPARAAEPALLVQLAITALGCRQPGVALPIAHGSGAPAPVVSLVECAARVELGERFDERSLAALEGPPAEAPGPWCEVVTLLQSEAHRRRGQTRTARLFAERAAELQSGPVTGAEALLARARAEGDARRPRAGLRALDRARPLARSAGLPGLLAHCHAEAARLHRLDANRSAAREATRAARALMRRNGSDRDAPTLPLHALFRVAEGTREG